MKKIILLQALIIGFILIGGIVGILLITGPAKEKSTPQMISTLQPTPALGIYEVCSEITGCEPEIGIKKIKEIGANAIIITVVDEDNFKSVSYYPSKYLPMVEDVPDNYLKQVIELAHKNQIKIYASINIPHNYWLERHTDWIAMWSNGQRADIYETDYFHRIVPPSRIIAEEECQELLKNIISEVVSYDVDGIDINDNFQFSDQYLEETDTTLYSSFDDFTIKKFGSDTNIAIQGNSPQEWANYIKNNSDIYLSWLRWRADQIIQLLKILKQVIKETGVDIPFRPHLLTHEDPYEYYGLDYQGIAKEVDILYLMITPDEKKEKYFEILKQAQTTQTKRIAVSTYLFQEEDWSTVERDKEKILERIKWIREAGAEEIYFYNFKLIEEGNFWSFIKSIFNKL